MLMCLLVITVYCQPPTTAESPPIQNCSNCHERAGPPTSPVSLQLLLADSVHAELECTDCHASISMDDVDANAPKPHGDVVEPVHCGECHDDEAEAYEMHGRLRVGADPDMPTCWSCHGSHEIRSSDDSLSWTHRGNLPKTCRSCHTNVDLVAEHEVLADEPIKLFEASVHGKNVRKGGFETATCIDCHGAVAEQGERTGHRIMSPSDPKAPTYRFNMPDTCGRCHPRIAEEYWEGIHGQLVKRGDMTSPICTECHGEHGIRPTSDLESPVSAARLAEATCDRCHESELLSERFGIPTGRVKSHIDSYHGLKRKAGDVHVANCASCHGDHRILPHTDPRSSIHPDNLQKTCGECHPGISQILATSSIHETAADSEEGWPRFFTVLYIWIIAVTIGLMLLHHFAHWFRHVRLNRLKGFVLRFNVNETVQHWVLMVSFTILVISGFSLRFSESWWVDILFGWGGGAGFLIRGTIHRVAAVVMTIGSIWHIGYLFSRRGRLWLRDMLPRWSDATHIKQNTLFFLGRGGEPRFGRFSYMEKVEYWALAWGTAIMTVTGIMLWFDDFFVEQFHLPKVVLTVALVIHYYEAWLATLAILVWHIYGAVFSPTVYPMNTAWWAGRMPKDMYFHEHPEGPRLRVRHHAPHPADEQEWPSDNTPQAEKQESEGTPGEDA